MLYRQVGTFLSYRQVDDMFGCCHWDKWVSLSAILLNDDYYQFMMEGRKIVDDICVMDAAYLIPFKMFAWIDLTDKKKKGEHVNKRDLAKHKYDVFRLLEIIPEDEKIPV